MKKVSLATIFLFTLIACSAQDKTLYISPGCTFFSFFVNYSIKCVPEVYEGINKLNTQPNFSFKSNDPSIFTVSSAGLVTGKSKGKAFLTISSDALSISLEINVQQTADGTITVNKISGVDTLETLNLNKGDSASHFSNSITVYANDFRYDGNSDPPKVSRGAGIQITIPIPNLNGVSYNLSSDNLPISYTDPFAQAGPTGNTPVWICKKGLIRLDFIIGNTYGFTLTNVECTGLEVPENVVLLNGTFTVAP